MSKEIGHDVRYDYGGLRLTCRTKGCQLATLRWQPASASRWTKRMRAFFAVHPPKNGRVLDDDGRKKPLYVENLLAED